MILAPTAESPKDIRWFQMSGAEKGSCYHQPNREYLYTKPSLYWRVKKAGKWSWVKATEKNLQISIRGPGKRADTHWTSSPEHFWLKCCLNAPYTGPGPILYAPEVDQ